MLSHEEADSCPPDEVERRIPDADTATRLLNDRYPLILRWLMERRDQFLAEHGPSELLDKAMRAAVITLARVSMRHGSLGEDHHHYHDEIHPTALLHRLYRIYESGRGDEIDPAERLFLSMFAGAHDLRQREDPNMGPDGVGGNERASADEWRRIMDIAGFDRRSDARIYELLTQMIHGTTFNIGIGPQSERWPLGAVAPALVDQIKRDHPDWRDDPDYRRMVKLIPLAADVDTGSVADAFDDYAVEAAKLAREMELRKGNGVLDGSTAGGVFGFLTDGQERFFFKLQQFNSDIAREVFAEDKRANGKRLKELTDWMRREYAGRIDDGDTTGEDVICAFLGKAREIAERDRDGHAVRGL